MCLLEAVFVFRSFVLIQVEVAFLTWLAIMSFRSETKWQWAFSAGNNVRVVLDLLIKVLEE